MGEQMWSNKNFTRLHHCFPRWFNGFEGNVRNAEAVIMNPRSLEFGRVCFQTSESVFLDA